MKRCFVFALVLVLLTLGGCGESKEWRRFESEEGQFSILFPGEPEQSAWALPGTEGKVQAKSFKAERESIAYSITLVDYPTYVVNDDPGEMLGRAIDEYMDSINAQARMKKEITLDGYPGWDLSFETLEQGATFVTRGRYYRVENREYSLAVVSTASDASSPDIDRFMDSFELER